MSAGEVTSIIHERGANCKKKFPYGRHLFTDWSQGPGMEHCRFPLSWKAVSDLLLLSLFFITTQKTFIFCVTAYIRWQMVY